MMGGVRRSAWLGVVLLALPLFTYPQPPGPPEAQAVLRVRLLQADGQPLANGTASGWLLVRSREGATGVPVRSFQTDAEGRGQIANERSGVWWLSLIARGAGWVSSPPLAVKAGAETPEAVLQLQPGGEVFGTVRLKGTGTPVADARVSCQPLAGAGGEPWSQTVTDQEGAFVFSDLPPGEVGLSASAEGYRPGSARVEVTLEGGPAEVAVELSLGGTIRGTVLGPDGQTPLVGAGVRLGTGGEAQVTDAEGRFLMIGVAAGPARLVVYPKGYAPVVQTVDVREGEETPEVRIVATHLGGTVTGTVTDTDRKQPAAGETLVVLPRESGSGMEYVTLDDIRHGAEGGNWAYWGADWTYTAQTDETGRYAVAHVPAGPCTVIVVRASGPRVERQGVR